MARVYLADPVKDVLKAHSPDEQEAIRRAVRLLADDVDRDAGKVDFFVEEGGLKVWGFFYGNVSIAFVEAPNDDITIVHAAMYSPLRPPPRGYE